MGPWRFLRHEPPLGPSEHCDGSALRHVCPRRSHLQGTVAALVGVHCPPRPGLPGSERPAGQRLVDAVFAVDLRHGHPAGQAGLPRGDLALRPRPGGLEPAPPRTAHRALPDPSGHGEEPGHPVQPWGRRKLLDPTQIVGLDARSCAAFRGGARLLAGRRRRMGQCGQQQLWGGHPPGPLGTAAVELRTRMDSAAAPHRTVLAPAAESRPLGLVHPAVHRLHLPGGAGGNPVAVCRPWLVAQVPIPARRLPPRRAPRRAHWRGLRAAAAHRQLGHGPECHWPGAAAVRHVQGRLVLDGRTVHRSPPQRRRPQSQ